MAQIFDSAFHRPMVKLLPDNVCYIRITSSKSGGPPPLPHQVSWTSVASLTIGNSIRIQKHALCNVVLPLTTQYLGYNLTHYLGVNQTY